MLQLNRLQFRSNLNKCEHNESLHFDRRWGSGRWINRLTSAARTPSHRKLISSRLHVHRPIDGTGTYGHLLFLLWDESIRFFCLLFFLCRDSWTDLSSNAERPYVRARREYMFYVRHCKRLQFMQQMTKTTAKIQYPSMWPRHQHTNRHTIFVQAIRRWRERHAAA